MRSEQIANQIIGFLFQAGGMYVIGDWKICCGLFLFAWGYGMMITPRQPKTEAAIATDWIGNKRAGG